MILFLIKYMTIEHTLSRREIALSQSVSSLVNNCATSGSMLGGDTGIDVSLVGVLPLAINMSYLKILYILLI